MNFNPSYPIIVYNNTNSNMKKNKVITAEIQDTMITYMAHSRQYITYR